MNSNLDTSQIKNYAHGGLLSKLYDFELRWYELNKVEADNFQLNKNEVKNYNKRIKDDVRVPGIIVLNDFGVVAGFHVLEAFRQLKYEKIPVIWGKLK